MLTGAILVVGSFSPRSMLDTPAFSAANCSSETLGHIPISCLEILGKSTLDRTIERLQDADIRPINVIAEKRFASVVATPAARGTRLHLAPASNALNSTAECVLRDCVQQGIETVILIRLGSYAEFDLADLIRFHRDRGQEVTPVTDGQRPVSFWVIQHDRVRRNRFLGMEELLEEKSGSEVEAYRLPGYVNHFENASDVRRLVIDALGARCAIRPSGREAKPGIWLGEGTQVHRHA